MRRPHICSHTSAIGLSEIDEVSGTISSLAAASSEKGSWLCGSISPLAHRFMPPDLNLSSDERECGCDKCKLKGWKTVTRKTYARHKEARERTQFSVEFQQFLQGPSTQILDSIPTTSIPSTSTSALLPISNRNEISQLPITIGDLSIDVSMMSLDDSEDEGKENEDEDGDENGKDSSHSEVGDVSMYTGGVEVRSRAFLLAEYIKNLLVALLHF